MKHSLRLSGIPISSGGVAAVTETTQSPEGPRGVIHLACKR